MKTRIAIALFSLIVVGAPTLLAQDPIIGVYSDSSCLSSVVGTQVSVPALGSTELHIAVHLGAGDPGISGAEFRVTGMTASGVTHFNSIIADVSAVVGDPVDEGTSLGLLSCETGPCIQLFSVTLLNATFSNQLTGVIAVESHTMPSDPNYPCSLVTRCDDPDFTRQCVGSDYCTPDLSDGGFEYQYPGASPVQFGLWGGDWAQRVAPDLGITPYGGSTMLKFRATDVDGGSRSGTGSDLKQLVGLCLVPNVDGGNVGVRASVRCNRVAGDAETDRMFQLILQALAGDPIDYDGTGALAEHSETLISDADPATWEELTTSLRLPPGTDYLAVWVRAVEDVMNDLLGEEFDGHYVDDARLEVGVAEYCEVMPQSIDFGAVSSARDSSITITNHGLLPIDGDVVSSCPDFSVLGGGGPFTLQQNESLVVDLRYDPQSPGPHHCALDLSIAGCGPLAYVADQSAGMQLIDIAEPTNPTLRSNWSGISYAPALKDGHAVVAHGGKWVRFVNVQSPATPFQVGSKDIGCCTRDVRIEGETAYVARSGTLSGLQIFGVANPASPSVLGTYLAADSSWKVDVQGDHAYLASSSEGLEILDVSDPNNPWREGRYAVPALTYGVDVVGDLAYLACANDGLQIVDVSNPTLPQYVGSYISGSSANDVVVRHEIAYLVSSPSGEPAALTIIDVSDPANPVELSELTAPATLLDIELHGDHAYMGATTAGLWIVDLSDPSSPTQSALYDTPGSASGLAIGGGVQLSGSLAAPTAVHEAPLARLGLGPAHPNPFVGTTSLWFTLEQPGAIDMTVYDLAGRRVRSLLSSSYPAGRHLVRWDGRDQLGNDVAQGLYLVRLSDGTRSLTRKVAHLR